MGVRWTEEQMQVISLRNRNLLVSAAAGSGKTATLVERIIRLITEGPEPLDIDQLLVVTFTKAAAAEMRERVGDAIERKKTEEPENKHLKKQALLLNSAQITTIDSFCLSVIQDYFHEINLDPVFRIAEQEELTLLQHDVAMEVLEEEYEKGEEDFLSFAQIYGGKHQDFNLEGYILKLYRFSESCPWPEQWLCRMEEGLAAGTGICKEPWLEEILRMTQEQLKECRKITQKAQEICGHIDGPHAYLDALLSDEELLGQLLSYQKGEGGKKKGFQSPGDAYEKLFQEFQEIKFTALSRKSMKECSPEKKEKVKALRDQVKSCVQGLKKDFYFQDFEEMESDWQKAAVPARVLLRLALAFHRKFAEKKAEKKILDFSDIEHFALQILVEEKDGVLAPRTAAKELRRQYAEIMIDEYQDSNEVQETILRSISREEEGRPNIFMVGDVKQSIYRFRLAKPELFLEKYNAYSKEDGLYQRIDLHKNFRSRSEVLFGINQLFFRIMGRGFGRIEYDADAALYPGAAYLDDKADHKMEIVLLEKNEEEDTKEEEQEEEPFSEEAEQDGKEWEAFWCARKIKELVSGGFAVQGKDADGNPALLPCRYRDIVILLRTMSGWADVFAQVLAANGVPAAVATQSGYFNVPEIKWLLNYLRLLDNPQQDLPAFSVLLSPFAGLTHDELARIRIEAPGGGGIYMGALWYEKNGEAEAVRKKLALFLDVFQKLRGRSKILTVPELLSELYERTGYDSYIAAMPSGEKRHDNLQMFSEKAAAFERSSYRGLFQFIRYVERLIKYEVDYGEAAGEDENGNAVRIMSIHKSKGLEFPIVFVCGTTKKFNFMDTREKIVFHPDQGIALDCIDEGMRTTIPTLKKKMLQSLMMEETLSEELRLLYVAMTRAKEKLYLIGHVKDYEKTRLKWESRSGGKDDKLYYTTLRQASCYMDFIGPALLGPDACHWIIVETSKLRQSQGEEKARKRREMEEFLFPDFRQRNAAEDKRAKIREYLMFSYPYEAEQFLPVKTSVSELKRKAFQEEEFEVPDFFSSPEENEGQEAAGPAPKKNPITLPEFLKESVERKGADRGTLYHKILECMPLTNDFGKAKIEEELRRMVQEEKILERDLAQIQVDKLARFYQSNVAKRMRNAKEQGKLCQEQPFVLAVPAGELYPMESKEPVLIQGIIDVFFEEEDGMVLLDYKTDYVPRGGEAALIQKYQKQLNLYQRALEEIRGKKVKEKIIYSFHLQKEIVLP